MKIAIRFLRQGFVEAEIPDGFNEMTPEQKMAWASDVLNEKSDKELINSMSDFKDGRAFFDESPTAEAIEDNEEDSEDYGSPIVQTVSWKIFSSFDGSDIVS